MSEPVDTTQEEPEEPLCPEERAALRKILLHIAHAAGNAALAVDSDDGTVLGRPDAVEWLGHAYSEMKDALKIIEDTWFEGFEPKLVKGVVEKWMSYTEWGEPDGWTTR